MRTARVDRCPQLLAMALDDVLYGGDWIGEKKEILNYVAEVRNPSSEPHPEHPQIVDALDDWHGYGHYDTTTNWTFPTDPDTGLTGELKPTNETGDYFERLVTPNNQLQEIVDKIDQWGRVNRACAQVWDREQDVSAMYPPCLMTLQVFYRDDEIHLTTYFRSHTVAKSYYGDLKALIRMQEWFANQLECGVGILTVMSGSLHIRKENDEHELAEQMGKMLL